VHLQNQDGTIVKIIRAPFTYKLVQSINSCGVHLLEKPRCNA